MLDPGCAAGVCGRTGGRVGPLRRGAVDLDHEVRCPRARGLTSGRCAPVQGACARAVGYSTRALELHRALPDEVHSKVPLALDDLAAAQRDLGQLDEAALHEEALALRRSPAPTRPVRGARVATRPSWPNEPDDWRDRSGRSLVPISRRRRATL
jgi:hypothetical protein